jgi:hypothetical protein
MMKIIIIVTIVIIVLFLVMEHRWKEIDRGNRNTQGKPIPVTFVSHKSYVD